MEIQILKDEFTVCKVESVKNMDLDQDFLFVGKTDEEISVVCLSSNTPNHTTSKEDEWKGFRICGMLDFSLVGILSKITTILADSQIGIFAISTFNTDYILVKKQNFVKAIELLIENGYTIVE